MTRMFSNGKSIQLLQGDITKIPVDAIANAANSELRGGGGVDGAIHSVGGPAIRLELDGIRASSGDCPTGSAVPTTAGNLPAKWVFHAVGPIYRGSKEDAELLASAYRACLKLAEEKSVKYMSFPSISTGVYGYPAKDAAPIALSEIALHLKNDQNKLQRVVFVLFDGQTLNAYSEALNSVE